jgi:hypothetical protein
MEAHNTWTIKTFNTEQENALKAFVKALKMKLTHTVETPYSNDFIKKMEQSKKEIKEGKGIKLEIKDIDNLWK